MLAPAASFTDFVLGLHILAVVVGFGVTFAYPLLLATADPSTFALLRRVSQRLVNPGLLVILICGLYLAGKEHQFSDFYVQWGIAAVIVLGGIEGGFMSPRFKTLAQGPAQGNTLQQVRLGGAVQSLIVVVTVFFMALHLGA